VPVAVLVTPGDDGRVVGVGYDFGAQGTTEGSPRAGEGEAGDTRAGWTRVTGEPAGDEVRGQVERASEALRAWAEDTGQRWAEPDGATALVEHVRERADGG
jgi:hypothetical protein